MYYILIVFSTFILFTTSLTHSKKYCNQCKHFKPSPSVLIEESKCKQFPVYINNEPIDLFKCLVARTYNDMCGEEGRYFKKKF
jgi:hypothetical protein